MFVWKLDVCMETICSYGNYDCLECLYGKYIFVLKIYFCMENMCLYGNYVYMETYVCMETLCFIWKLDVCVGATCFYGN